LLISLNLITAESATIKTIKNNELLLHTEGYLVRLYSMYPQNFILAEQRFNHKFGIQ